MKKKLAALALVAVVAMGLTGCSTTNTTSNVNCRVISKDHSINNQGGAVYRIYSSCGVFNVEDAPLLGKFNSADLYASIELTHTYDFETTGFRNGFFSAFPDIIKATEVADK